MFSLNTIREGRYSEMVLIMIDFVILTISLMWFANSDREEKKEIAKK
jgi:hypothetical protein